MVTYEQWNKAIISYFFEECEPGEIVFLQTNAEILSEIAELSDFDVVDAAESLKGAVRKKIVTAWGKINVSQIEPPISANLQTDFLDKEPPQVAFLALTVLAASMMETSEEILHTNYYTPLNQLLFDEQWKGCPKGIHLLQIELFWKHLQLWALHQHAVLYLTEGSSSRRYVWYPISQCLISKHDRRAIYQFFRNHKLTPFSRGDDNQLEKDLRIWSRLSVGSAKIERYFSNESYKKSILNQVKSLLRHWNGEIPPEPPRGKKQTTAAADIELRFDLFGNNVEIRYWLPTRGRGEIRCRTNPLGIQSLQPSHLKKWFRPVPDNSNTFWNLPNPLQLQTDETNSIIYTIGYSNIWIFRKDPERDDGWLSQRNMRLYEDHLIVFRKGLVNQVVDCLSKTCEEKIEDLNHIYVDGKENDWLYLRVKPIKPISFSSQELWKLSVDSGERIRLIDGLSVRDQYGQRAYLDICLPIVFVPDFGLHGQEPLRIDEQEFSLNKDRLVPLHNALGPGIYPLTYVGQTRELRIISPERSLEHCDHTLLVSVSEDQTSIPTYAMKKISEVSEGSGIWLTGAKLFGDIPLPSPPPPPIDKVPAHIISSVVKVAIDFKQGKTSVPEWFDEAIECLDQNVVLRALVEKKLNLYHEKALSYIELRKQIGK